MNEQIFNTRIQQKHDIEANWLNANNFIPKQGELIIYDADEKNSIARIKIGDGENFINNLPFITIQIDSSLSVEGAAADSQVVGKIFNLVLEMIEAKQNKAVSSLTEPTEAVDGDFWIDTSESTYAQKKIHESPTEPQNSQDGDLWIDTSDMV